MPNVVPSTEAKNMLRSFGYSADVTPPDVSELPIQAFKFSQDDFVEHDASINYDQMIDSVLEELAIYSQNHTEIQLESIEAQNWNKTRWTLIDGNNFSKQVVPIAGFSFTKPSEIHGSNLVRFLQKWKSKGRFSIFAGLVEEMNMRRWNPKYAADSGDWQPLLELANLFEIPYELDEGRFGSASTSSNFHMYMSALHEMLHVIATSVPEKSDKANVRAEGAAHKEAAEEQNDDALLRGALSYLRTQFRRALEDERRQEQERRRRDECVQKLAFEEGDPLEACELVFRHARRLALHGSAHDFHYDCPMFSLPRRGSGGTLGGCSGDVVSPSYHGTKGRSGFAAAVDGVPTWAMTLLMLRHGADRSDPFALFRLIHPYHETLEVTLVVVRNGGGGVFRCGFRRVEEAAAAGGGAGSGGGRAEQAGPALREMSVGTVQRFEFPADGPGVTGLVCELLPAPGAAGASAPRLAGSLPASAFGPCRAAGWERELCVRLEAGPPGVAAAAPVEAVVRIRYADAAGGGQVVGPDLQA